MRCVVSPWRGRCWNVTYHPVLCTRLLLLSPPLCPSSHLLLLSICSGSSTGQDSTAASRLLRPPALGDDVLLELRGSELTIIQIRQRAPNEVRHPFPSAASGGSALFPSLPSWLCAGIGVAQGQALWRDDEMDSVFQKLKVHWNSCHSHQHAC